MSFKDMEERSKSLTPCPFCGSSDLTLTIYSGESTIFCSGCPAMMGGEESKCTEDELVSAWNSRNTVSVASNVVDDSAFNRIDEVLTSHPIETNLAAQRLLRRKPSWEK